MFGGAHALCRTAQSVFIQYPFVSYDARYCLYGFVFLLRTHRVEVFADPGGDLAGDTGAQLPGLLGAEVEDAGSCIEIVVPPG